MTNKFAWFEMHFNPSFIEADEFSSGEIIDLRAMQKVLKENLMQSNLKTMQWQTLAISKAVPTD